MPPNLSHCGGAQEHAAQIQNVPFIQRVLKARANSRWVLAIVLLLSLFAQHRAVTAANFARNYGQVGANVSVSHISADATGEYIAGSFTGATATFGGVTLTHIGVQDVFVAKLDATGNVLWAKNFGGSGASVGGSAIATDGAGGVYLAGSFYGANLTTPALTMIGTNDAFALKLAAVDGSISWAKNYGGSGATAYGHGIAADGAGGMYLAGYFYGANLTTPALTKIGRQDAFAFKLAAADGTVGWAKNFGGSGGGGAFAYGLGVAIDGAGGVYLGGQFSAADLTSPALTMMGLQDAFALKLAAADGTVGWAKNFGGSGAWVEGNAIMTDGAGGVYLGGAFQLANLTTPPRTLIGTRDVFALKLAAADGTVGWAKNFGGSGANPYCYTLAIDGAGGVYLGGFISGADLTTPALTKIGSQDAFALKLAAGNGTVGWAKNYGGSGAWAYIHGIVADGVGGVYLAGGFSTANLTTPALSKIGNADAFIIDQGDPSNGSSGAVVAVPTLNEWMLALLAGLLLGAGAVTMHRRQR